MRKIHVECDIFYSRAFISITHAENIFRMRYIALTCVKLYNACAKYFPHAIFLFACVYFDKACVKYMSNATYFDPAYGKYLPHAIYYTHMCKII